MNKLTVIILSVFIITTLTFVACSKGGGGTNPPANPCASKTIAVTGTTTPTTNATATNGSIAASATGSTGFTYSLNGGTTQASGTFTGLGVGNYTVTAKDGDGCTGTQSFTVTAAPCPTITVTATITPASSPTATNGSIAATGNGSTGFTYSINGISGTYQASGTFSNLSAGTYTIFAKDVNGCTGSQSFIVTAASCPTITLNTTPTNTSGPTATNGSIVAVASGGATPYSYSKDAGATYQATGTFNNLAVGSYTVVAKDANGCLSVNSTVNITASCPTITVNPTTTNTIKCESNTGTITIAATGGATPYTYSKDGGTTFQSSNIFNLLATGNYNLSVKDAFGCTNTSSATVSQAPAGTLFSAVKAVLATNCAVPGCHSGAAPQNGLNFADDCTIVSQGLRIKARAVDFNPSQMPPSGPPISVADRQKIVDWIAAGGKHNN
jgi:hypothetical protein